MSLKKIMLVTLFVLSAFSVAYGDATMKADRQAADTACASDATTAGCPGATVGKGLIKCLARYKHKNPSYEFSASCKAARDQWKADKKANK